jgi:hypothetical protein
MKQLLFKTTAVVIGSLISANTSIGNAITTVVAFVFNAVNEVLRGAGKKLMNVIDSERFQHIELTTDQYSELTELNLLMAANKVKEDALRGRTWTVMHTMAMNRIGTALHNNCGWDPPRIHGYLRQVVESIPGMVYCAGDEYEPE